MKPVLSLFRLGFSALVPLALIACGSDPETKTTSLPSEKSHAPLNDAPSPSETVGGISETNESVSISTLDSSVPTEPRVELLEKPRPAPTASRSEAEIQEILRKTNPGYQGQGVFHRDPSGQEIIAVEFPPCGIRDLAALKGSKLKILYLTGNPISDLRHLRNMPLEELALENTEIADLRPLQGMPLGKLWLNQCSRLRSLTGLEGMQIQELYLPGTQVSDLTPLQGMPLRGLWLTGAPVTDLKPLTNSTLVSLTLHRTKVSDLSVISDLPFLQRLHIGESKVTDLTPLKGMSLTRLVFTPKNIQKGIEQARRLRGLNEIGTRFDDEARELTPPAAFWSRYDAGGFK